MKNTVLIFLCSILTILLISCGSIQTDQAPEEQGETLDYKEMGLEITSSAFAKLSSNLMEAMESGGVSEAVKYCHVEAYPLTDAVAEDYEVSIRRVSSRYRNFSNAPVDWEVDLLNHYEAYSDPTAASDSLIFLEDGAVVYARPILLQGPCIKCHGTPGTDIADKDYALIKSLYPDDRAIGFAPGDLRGMWVVKFKDK